MSGPGIPTLRSGVAADWHSLQRLLIDAGLPVEDLGPALLEGFLIAESDECESGESIIGAVGLQVFDNIGLLRSLVVAKSARKSGLGGKLLGALEAAAQVAGIDELWLLTIDADAFFERRGFDIAPREQAPESIRQTEEFRELCPGDAFLMVKSLR